MPAMINFSMIHRDDPLKKSSHLQKSQYHKSIRTQYPCLFGLLMNELVAWDERNGQNSRYGHSHKRKMLLEKKPPRWMIERTLTANLR